MRLLLHKVLLPSCDVHLKFFSDLAWFQGRFQIRNDLESRIWIRIESFRIQNNVEKIKILKKAEEI
jgi:hypothetical protein